LEGAIAKMDAGQPVLAIPICQKLLEKHPHHSVVLHELSLAYRLAGEPRNAILTLGPYEAQLHDDMLAGLAGAHDEAGEPTEAVSLLLRGIGRFPKSGLLYSELGTTLRGQEKFEDAIGAYMKGIEVEPGWPSNYLNASTMLAKSDLAGLSLLYGEMFRNLEPGTVRSHEVGAMLVHILRERITVEPGSGQGDGDDAKGNIRVRLVSPEFTGGNPEHPLQVFELSHLPLAIAALDGWTLEKIVSARTKSINVWWEATKSNADDDPLLAFLHDLSEAGHAEAYHYWLYGPGYPEDAQAWMKAHPKQLESMAEYVGDHQLAAYLEAP
jgi:tetratricopeptide (TPR) repeat protein